MLPDAFTHLLPTAQSASNEHAIAGVPNINDRKMIVYLMTHHPEHRALLQA